MRIALDTTRPEDPLLVIERGDAARLRPRCRSGELICPLPDCKDPRLSTRAGEHRGDHFFHVGARETDHPSESLDHFTLKHTVARRIRNLHPTAIVTVDGVAIENGQIPDVLTVFEDSSRLAVEIQLAAIGPEEWLVRHQGYEALGIRDIWLFGGSHLSLHDADAEFRAQDALSLNDLAVKTSIVTSLLDGADGPYWIKADSGMIGTKIWSDVEVEVANPKSVRWIDGFAHLFADDPREAIVRFVDLAACQFGPNGLDSPTFRTSEGEAFSPASTHRGTTEAKIEDRKHKREAIARDNIYDYEEAHRKAERARENRLRRERYLRYRAEHLAVLGPALPVIEHRTGSDTAIDMYPAHWKANLYLKRIAGRSGSSLTFAGLAAPMIAKRLGEPKAVYKAIAAFLFRLRERDIVDFDTTGRRFISGPIWILDEAERVAA